MGHKNKVIPKGIRENLWEYTNEISADDILQTVKNYCMCEDGSIPSDSEISAIQNLAQNSFVKLIYAAAEDHGYNSF